ncbi:hypothetical protein MJG53_018491 [Ovis ammon polii x Ovis aries]|uniref:Uncharacterized protein n=1 Tax=Ovis ammon polii x Ovis aries TaxID=2918886 RepID=A0ACB9U3T7_9CETA|nr:hypothetical protein MJG53_018491 [Ovis ammon polii x Ovis aries]
MGGAAAPPGDQVGPLRLQRSSNSLCYGFRGLHPAQGCGGPESRRVKMKDTTQPKLRSLDKILRYTKDQLVLPVLLFAEMRDVQCLSPGGKEQDAVSRALSIAWKAVVPLDPSGPWGGSGTLATEAKRVALGKKKNQPFFSFYYKEMRRDISGVEQKASDVLTCRVSLLVKGPLTISHTVRARWHLLCVRLCVIVHLQVRGPLAQTIWDLTPSFLTVTPGDFLRLPKFGNTWPFHGLGKLPEIAVGESPPRTRIPGNEGSYPGSCVHPQHGFLSVIACKEKLSQDRASQFCFCFLTYVNCKSFHIRQNENKGDCWELDPGPAFPGEDPTVSALENEHQERGPGANCDILYRLGRLTLPFDAVYSHLHCVYIWLQKLVKQNYKVERRPMINYLVFVTP